MSSPQQRPSLRFLASPKWIGFHLLVVAGMIAMVNLSLWQLRRLDQRQAFNATVEARYDASPEPLDAVLGAGVSPADVEWRPVIVSGTYLTGSTVRIVNRSQNGFAGDNVVDPMRLDDGRILFVNRGFVPQDGAVEAAPVGTVELTGRLRTSEQRRLGQLTDAPDGVLREAQRLDIDRLAEQVDGEPIPLSLEVISSSPADTPALQAMIRPDLSEGPHLSYAIQWLIFTVCVGVGWVLAVRRSIRNRTGPG